MFKRNWVAAVMLSLFFWHGIAPEVSAAEKPTALDTDAALEGPFKDRPSAPGPHIEKIKALGKGQWLNLGVPQADPQWGRAYGAAWGGHSLVLAPDLRGAFRAGEGVHGGTRKVNGDTYGLDSYWFYDINLHQWVCLFPGTNVDKFNEAVKSGTLKVDDLGRVVDKTGQPVPCHLMIHAWGFLTYDTHQNIFYSSGGYGYGGYYFPGNKAGWERCKEGIDALKAQGFGKRPKGTAMGRLEYHPHKGRFVWEPNKNAQPKVGGFARHLYIPSKKEHFAAGSGGVVFYNPATKSWRRVASPGQGPKGYDFIGCLDTKRQRAYVGNNGENFFCFDMASEKWSKVENSKNYAFGNTNGASVTYDTAADKILVWSFGKTNSLLVLDPATNVWEEAIPFEGEFPSKRASTNAVFYDPELAVHFIFTAGDSRDGGVMWVYRYATQ